MWSLPSALQGGKEFLRCPVTPPPPFRAEGLGEVGFAGRSESPPPLLTSPPPRGGEGFQGLLPSALQGGGVGGGGLRRQLGVTPTSPDLSAPKGRRGIPAGA